MGLSRDHRWILILTIVGASWLLLWYQNRIVPAKGTLVLKQAAFAASSAETPPTAADWQSRRLPDSLPLQGATAIQGWYRMDFAIPESSRSLWGLYLPCLSMSTAVFLNGRQIGQSGSFSPSMVRNWNRPLSFILPEGLLRPGSNRLDLRVAAAPPGPAVLCAPQLGKALDLQPVYQHRLFFKVTAVEILTIISLVVMLFMAALWLLRRSEPVFGWFSVGLLVWSLHNQYLVVLDSSLPRLAWDWFWYASMAWLVLLIIPYSHSFLGLRRPRLDTAVLVSAGVVSLLLAWFAISDPELFYPVASKGLTSALMISGIYPTWLMFRANLNHSDFEVAWILSAGLLVLSLGGRDWIMDLGLIGRWDGYFMQYSIPLALVTFGWVLLTRFVGALRESESLNNELEARVQEKTLALERNHQQLRRLERQQILAEERERIMRDMHDGVGGHLVSALAMVENGAQGEQLTPALREALEDLRLMIDSLEPTDDDLPAVLGQLRERLRPRLESAGIEVLWRVGELPPVPDLGPHKVLNILRILQEAITNVIRHAQATQLTLATSYFLSPEDDAWVMVEIRDDGIGLGNTPSTGRGIPGMYRRSEKIGAHFLIETSNEGTRVKLRLPVSKIPLESNT